MLYILRQMKSLRIKLTFYFTESFRLKLLESYYEKTEIVLKIRSLSQIIEPSNKNKVKTKWPYLCSFS